MACNGDSTTLPKTFADLPGSMTTAQLPAGTPMQAAALVILTAQAAAKATTALFTPTADGFYRVSAYAKVTLASVGGTPSSTLGGATGLVITYTDPDGVAQSMTVIMGTQAGAAAINNAANTTAAKLQGDVYIHAKANVAVQFAFGYTSAGTTPMQYKLVLKSEAI